MTLKPDCASKASFLEISLALAAVASDADNNTRIVPILAIPVSVNSFFICFRVGCFRWYLTLVEPEDEILSIECGRLPISQSIYAHRAKATELLNFDIVGSG